jgi:hypothetical protein
VGDDHERTQKREGFAVRMKEDEQGEANFVHKILQKKWRKRLEPLFVKIPRHWITSLRQSRSPTTFMLAHTILWEVFRRKFVGGEITLSKEVVPYMSRTAKIKAAKELEQLRLIDLSLREGRKALRVTRVYL